MTEIERVSVVVPAFNVETWLAGAIESVVSQDPAPHEVIVVDDGSTDGTARLAESIGPGVKLVRRPNGGLAAARNTGVDAATGDLILFLDADDELLPGALAVLIDLRRRFPDAAAYIPNHNEVGPGVAQLSWPTWPEPKVLSRADLARLLRRNWLRANCLVPRDVAIESRFDEAFRAMEDTLFFSQLLLRGRSIVVSGEPGIEMRVKREGSLTSRVVHMRHSRRLAFKRLLREPDLSVTEKAVLRYASMKSFAGEILARRTDRESPKTRVSKVNAGERQISVLQVLLDEPGGASAALDVIEANLPPEFVSSRLLIPPSSVRVPGASLLRALWGLRKRARDTRAEVVHAHGVRAGIAVRLARAVGMRAPVVVTVQGLHALRRSKGTRRTIAARFTRLALRSASSVITVSHSDMSTIIDEGLAAGSRVLLTSQAFTPLATRDRAQARREIGLEEGMRVVLWIGRFVDQKNPELFVEAVAGLKTAVTALMVGDGPLAGPIAGACDRLSAQVRLEGWQADPSTHVAASDVVVSTARWEGFPLMLLEAATAGACLVATDTPGNRDAAGTGIPIVLVTDADPQALSEAIDRLLLDDRKRTEMGREAQKVSLELAKSGRSTESIVTAYRRAVGISR